jgi:hypothetical protein
MLQWINCRSFFPTDQSLSANFTHDNWSVSLAGVYITSQRILSLFLLISDHCSVDFLFDKLSLNWTDVFFIYWSLQRLPTFSVAADRWIYVVAVLTIH